MIDFNFNAIYMVEQSQIFQWEYKNTQMHVNHFPSPQPPKIKECPWFFGQIKWAVEQKEIKNENSNERYLSFGIGNGK